MRTPREIREKLEDVKPSWRGLSASERALVLENRAERSRAIGDEGSEGLYSSLADEARAAAEAGDTAVSRIPEAPHLGEITIRKVGSEQQVPVRVVPPGQHAA